MVVLGVVGSVFKVYTLELSVTLTDPTLVTDDFRFFVNRFTFCFFFATTFFLAGGYKVVN